MLSALALLTTISASAAPGLEPAAVTSFWLAKVDRHATHSAPLNASQGTYAMDTFAFVFDAWVKERLAVGGAYTVAYGSNEAPFIYLLEGRLSTRHALTERLALVGVVSAGFPQTNKGFRASAPSTGLDIGLSIRLGGHVALRTDIGAIRVAFAKKETEIVQDESGEPSVADVERTLVLKALRFTVGVVVDI